MVLDNCITLGVFRYVLICDCPKLADFFDGLVTQISEFSFRLASDGSTFEQSQNFQGGHPSRCAYSLMSLLLWYKLVSLACIGLDFNVVENHSGMWLTILN